MISQSGASANIRPTQTSSSAKRLVPRPPIPEIAAYELGLREWQRVAGGVTTIVTAKEPGDELALDRITSIPPNVVTVESAYVREVEHVKPGYCTTIRRVSDEEHNRKTPNADTDADDLFTNYV